MFMPQTGGEMIKADLVEIVARETKITKTQAERAVNAAIDSLRGALMDGKRIELRGFGVFQVKPRKRGIGRNPRTKEEVEIPPGKTIRFKPGKNLQNIP
jgi:DNA-binding protein HU-beta